MVLEAAGFSCGRLPALLMRPIGAVAHRCGYSTPSAFIASFRRAFGSTPGACVRG
jgi:AraC-like DNA-binding protein